MNNFVEKWVISRKDNFCSNAKSLQMRLIVRRIARNGFWRVRGRKILAFIDSNIF